MLAILLLSADLTAQRPTFTKSINIRGWKVPLPDKAEWSDESIDIEGISVDRQSFLLSQIKPFIMLRRGKCEFSWLASYAIEGTVFAVSGDCLKFGNDTRYGKFYYGGSTNFTYYDEDGDGKFESRYSSGFMPVFVPHSLKVNHGPPPFPSKILP